MTTPDETTLIQSAKRGALWPWAHLYRQHYSAVKAHCRSIIHDDTIADDLSQDTFVKAMAKIRQFRGEAQFKRWLHAIAKNTALGFKRRKQLTLLGEEIHERPLRILPQHGERTSEYDNFVEWLCSHNPTVGKHFEAHRHLLDSGRFADLPKQTQAKYRRNNQRIRTIVNMLNVNRRDFLAAAASLPLSHLGRTRDQYFEQMNHAIQTIRQKRVTTGNVFACRDRIDNIVANPLLSQDLSLGETETLLGLLDLQIALALDACDVQTCSNILPRMKRLVGRLRGVSQVRWETRYVQNSARRFYHLGNVSTAAQLSTNITRGLSANAFRHSIAGGNSGPEATMTCFEIGSFTGALDIAVGLEWWRDALHRLVDAGDTVNAVRVEARILRAEVEQTPRDAGRALAALQRLSELTLLEPKIVHAPMHNVQLGACQVSCHIAARSEDQALVIARQLISDSKHIGYNQGILRLRRAFRGACPTFRTHADRVLDVC